ncbi:MAG: OmpH family outer membrane protein [Verrucomicrobiota bacterium]
MNYSKAIPLLLIASSLAASAAPRFALVRVKEIYSALPSTTALQEQVKKERDEIMKNERAEGLRKIISELQTLQSQLSDKSKPLDESTSKSLARNYEIKRQEALTLQQEFEGFQTEQEKVINKKMVAGMRESLDRIAQVSAKIAKERGYDSVFDSSGNTNTGVPFILFSKDAPDITADIQAALKDGETAVAADKKKDPAK